MFIDICDVRRVHFSVELQLILPWELNSYNRKQALSLGSLTLYD